MNPTHFSRLPLPTVAMLLMLATPTAAQERAAAGAKMESVPGTVLSKDGTRISYERSGKGPAVILVACALADRRGTRALAGLLAPSATVFNYDRRGRGQSGDGKTYAVEREIEDIAALIAAAGGSAALFGSSSGAALALEAADALRGKVSAVALFEPPFVVDDSRPPIPDAVMKEIGTLLAQDRRGDAVATFMTRCVGVPDEMVVGMRKAPMWAGLEQLAHTLPYDGAIVAGLQGGKPLPPERWRSVTARVLVIDGENSGSSARNTASALARSLSGARRHTLSGQDHSAVFTAPGSLAPVLVDFFTAPQPETAPRAKPGGGQR